MTVTAVHKDTEALTLSVTSEFATSPERVWTLWDDPRQLERWWGPPTYPATFTTHDLTPGGRAEYHMTGPDGDQPKGFWQIIATDPPRFLAFSDGFRNDDGTENDDFPRINVEVEITDIGHGHTRMVIESSFASADAMNQLMTMGMQEGLTEAVGQIDAILAERPLPTTTS